MMYYGSVSQETKGLKADTIESNGEVGVQQR